MVFSTRDALTFLCTAFSLLLFNDACRSQFTPGRLAVLELETGTTAGGALKIREFGVDGTPGIMLPVPSTGPNAIVGAVSSVIASQMVLTPAGDRLVFAGYGSFGPAGVSITTTSSAAVPRVIASVDAGGTFSRVATTSTFFDAGAINAVATDGVHYWGAGSNSGVCYLGPGAAQVINTEAIPISALGNCNGQLWSTTGGGAYPVGAGMPTIPSALGLPILTSICQDISVSPDGNTAYTAHFANLRKWSWNGSTWTNIYTLSCAPGAWLTRITVDYSAAAPVIYGMHNVPSKLVKWVDNGAGSTEQLLYISTGPQRWYGIAFTPSGCEPGTVCDDNNPATGNDVVGANCICAGQPVDCNGVFGGGAWVGTPCDDGNTLTGNDTWLSGCVCTGQTVLVSAKVILSGALPGTGSLMNDQLRSLPAFPLTEPYTAMGLPTAAGGTSIAQSVLSVSGLNAIVDWVLLELRSPATPSTVLVRRAALLQRDGDVVDLDGTSPVSCPIAVGSYHVAMRHRNHLGVMTAAAFALGPTATAVDLRFASTPTYGTDALRNMGTFMALWSGNAQLDGKVSYTGSGNDRDPILVSVGSTTPNNSQTGQYSLRDVNLNGTVSYAGTANDRDPVLVVVGSTDPTNVRLEQLP